MDELFDEMIVEDQEELDALLELQEEQESSFLMDLHSKIETTGSIRATKIA